MDKKFTTTAIKISLVGGSFVGAGLLMAALVFFQGGEVLIQSLESKTNSGGPVFNRIRLIPGWKRDIWMMNQSHHGLSADSQSWDRLAIVVDKSGPMQTAQFVQLPPGKLVWEDQLLNQRVNFRVSCFLCHSNGPRAIRPEWQSDNLSIGDQFKIQLWNLRVKAYGRVLENSEHTKLDPQLKHPFRYRGVAENQELRSTVCSRCHNEEGFVRRGFLTRQNFLAIEFMIENKLMPPPGFELSIKDRLELKEFLNGI